MALHGHGKQIAVIAAVAAAIFLTGITIAALSANQTVPLAGTITAINLGVYTDSACTQNCTTLNAGTLSPGAIYTQTLYVKNTGNLPETLTMTVNNWNPTNANTYLTLTWNQQNVLLNPAQTVQGTLTLTVAPNTGSLTSFSCSIIFTGTQQ